MGASFARLEARVKTGVRPHVVFIVAGVLSIAILAWAGVRAWRLDNTRRDDLRRAEATLTTFAALRQRYEPAVAAESIAWRRTWLQLQELGVGPDERLSLTQRVARAAESAGLRSVRVHIEPADTAGLQARPSTEGVQSKLASYSLRVECRGSLEAVLGFLGQLPPSVAPTQLSLVRQDGRSPHRISLAVYELTFTNGVPRGWSSLERSDPGAGDGSRPGG
jgi:hypothetical protein